MRIEDVLVIGAGPAGLATSACLHRVGIAHEVIERSHEVGHMWQRHYDRLHLHTIKAHSDLPFMPWPKDTPKYPSRHQVVNYFQTYARLHGITPAFGIEVQQIQRIGNGFEVQTSAGIKQARVVVMATGYNQVKKIPDFRGLSTFKGPVVHTADYKNPAPFKGQRTLVVGCGNSGAEIALDLAEHGVDVSMVVRGPVHVTPRDMFGRPAQSTNIMLSKLPIGIRDIIATNALKLVVGDLSKWGIARPTMGPNRMIEQLGRVPILDIGTIAKVKAGQIQIRPGVQVIHRKQIQFADGSLHPYDAIIMATGYETGLSKLIAGFDAIADHRGAHIVLVMKPTYQGCFLSVSKIHPQAHCERLKKKRPW